MKQNIFLCGICVLLLLSCKKDNKKDTNDTSSDKLYPVTFNVSGFSQSNVPVSIKSAKNGLITHSIDSMPNIISFVLFDANGLPVDFKQSKKGNAGYGTVTGMYKPGNYTAAFCGTDTPSVTLGDDGFGEQAWISSIYGNGYEYGVWGDTFYKKIPITITPAGLNQPVEIERLNGQLVLNIEDAIPPDAQVLIIRFNEYDTMDLYTGVKRSYGYWENRIDFKASDIDKTNFRVTMNTLNDITPFKVTLIVYNDDPYSDNDPVKEIVINNVVCKKNVRTILSGKVFDYPGQPNSGFTITSDNTWGGGNVTTDF